MTTITISRTMKQQLEHLRDEVYEFSSLDDTVVALVKNPRPDTPIVTSGDDERLTETVMVTESTLALINMVREKEGHEDYDAVLRDRAAVEPRDHGERPIEVTPLDD